MKLYQNILEKLYQYRFELFLATLIFNLFGPLFIFNDQLFSTYLFPISLLANIAFGINLILNRKARFLVIVLFVLTAFVTGFEMLNTDMSNLNLIKFGFYFLFYMFITYVIIKQIWNSKTVSKNLIIGVISGYICMGLIGYFIFMAVEIHTAGSFTGGIFEESATFIEKSNNLLYFSYITLMSIGYGEIVPGTVVAQRASVLLGLMGQFYLVIITAVVVGKYVNQVNNKLR